MSVALYMDVHVRRAVTEGLRLRGVDVLTAQEDGNQRMPDALLLRRATALGRVLFTQDEDFLAEAALLHRTGGSFAGIIYAHQLRLNVGTCVADLELAAKFTDPQDWANRVEYLPFR